jgi:hypothetical protein
MAMRYDGIPTGYKSKFETSILRHKYHSYLLVYIADNILSDDLPIVSRSFGWWRDPDGREKYGKYGSYPCRVGLSEGQCLSLSYFVNNAQS